MILIVHSLREFGVYVQEETEELECEIEFLTINM